MKKEWLTVDGFWGTNHFSNLLICFFFGMDLADLAVLWAPHIGVRHVWCPTARSQAVSMPGGWYPDDRFQRLFWVKRGMPQPKDYQD